MEAPAHQQHATDTRRSAIRRSIGLRVLAAVVLISFVCFVGDLRRKRNGTAQMERYAAALNGAIGESGVLPLNLDAAQWLEEDARPITMAVLTRDEVGCLRKADHPMMIAWTVRLIQVLGINGRAIVRYQNGHVEPAWVGESVFNSISDGQRAKLRACE